MVKCMASLAIWSRYVFLVVNVRILHNLSLMHMRDFARVKLLWSQVKWVQHTLVKTRTVFPVNVQ